MDDGGETENSQSLSHAGDDVGEEHAGDGLPRWLPPTLLFGVLCTLELLIYVDRGSFASNGINQQIQDDLDLSDAADGFMQTCFIMGLLVASPLFAYLATADRAFRLIGVGQVIWIFALLLGSVADGFSSLALSRTVVGVGEASFCAVAPVFIDDYAPKSQRGTWLAVYYAFIPVGVAAGYMYGGLIAAVVSWRVAFVLQTLIMVPFTVFFLSVNVKLKVNQADARSVERTVEGPEEAYLDKVVNDLKHEIATCMKIKLFQYIFWGAASFTFVIGGMAFWGPKAGKQIFNIKGNGADLSFGLLALLSGVIGTLMSGAIMYVVQQRKQALSNLYLLNAITITVGTLFCCLSVTMGNFGLFCVFVGLGLLCLFMSQPPVYVMALQVVPSRYRQMACALLTVAAHMFGDGPSPYIVGVVKSILPWRKTLFLLSLCLIPGIFFFARGHLYSKTFIDPYADADMATAGDQEPLLSVPGHSSYNDDKPSDEEKRSA